ncbi:MAG TPA: S-layer homology domain-containing protein [Chloroflexia bacterium]|nr:S-layer homology domain-containing protein [Chloroflexia bacterium]
MKISLRKQLSSESKHEKRSRSLPWLGFAIVPVLLIVALFAGLLSATAPAVSAAGMHQVGTSGTPIASATEQVAPLPPGEAPPTSAPDGGLGPAGWEIDALRDLAEVQDWPPIVSRDINGRMTVSQVISSTEWSLAVIRSFDYRPGAVAAFAAEQEDARVSGFQVTTENYFTYPAYWAVLSDGSGRAIEMRFHWLAGTWIMGVDISRPGVRTGDVRTISQQLLALSLQYGLPTPTPGLPATATTIAGSPTSTRTVVPCGVAFDDVQPDYWAYRFISELACDGIVSGYSDGSFRPQNSTTRAQLAKMVVLSEGWTLLSPAQQTFDDVGLSHLFYRYIETAHVHGVVSGYGDGTFKPDDFVSRAQVAKMIVKGRNWPLRVTSPVTLCDVGTGHWARDFIQVAIERGIFTGYGDGCFHPDAPATRAQLAKVMTLSRR